MADEVEITIASHPRWLRVVRGMVREFASEAGFSTRDSDAITLAVGEAVGNVIKHSFKGRTDRQFTVECAARAGVVEFCIRDDGEPFDPDLVPRLRPDELRAGGRGLYLMHSIMDEVRYERDGDLNVLRMKKALGTPAMERN